MAADDDIQDSSAPLIEHLAELRQRLIYSFVAFIIGMIICFTIWNPIFDFLTHPLCSAMALRGHSDCGLILIKLQEGFFVAISISLLGGLVLSFPIIGFQMEPLKSKVLIKVLTKKTELKSPTWKEKTGKSSRSLIRWT